MTFEPESESRRVISVLARRRLRGSASVSPSPARWTGRPASGERCVSSAVRTLAPWSRGWPSTRASVRPVHRRRRGHSITAARSAACRPGDTPQLPDRDPAQSPPHRRRQVTCAGPRWIPGSKKPRKQAVLPPERALRSHSDAHPPHSEARDHAEPRTRSCHRDARGPGGPHASAPG
jgi:hypothetical protein